MYQKHDNQKYSGLERVFTKGKRRGSITVDVTKDPPPPGSDMNSSDPHLVWNSDAKPKPNLTSSIQYFQGQGSHVKFRGEN